MGTQFALVYNRFLGKITDDLYMELTPEDTIRDLSNLLIDAVPGFEFPKQSLEYVIEHKENSNEGFVISKADGTKYSDTSYFIADLTSEEINILAILMMNGWLQRQVTSIENIRMKYGGTDFKMTSQAAHLGKLLTLLTETQRQSHHMQRLYTRRTVGNDGKIKSNWSILRSNNIKTGTTAVEETVEELIYDGGSI
jgi:hypothetical protein